MNSSQSTPTPTQAFSTAGSVESAIIDLDLALLPRQKSKILPTSTTSSPAVRPKTSVEKASWKFQRIIKKAVSFDRKLHCRVCHLEKCQCRGGELAMDEVASQQSHWTTSKSQKLCHCFPDDCHCPCDSCAMEMEIGQFNEVEQKAKTEWKKLAKSIFAHEVKQVCQCPPDKCICVFEPPGNFKTEAWKDVEVGTKPALFCHCIGQCNCDCGECLMFKTGTVECGALDTLKSSDAPKSSMGTFGMGNNRNYQDDDETEEDKLVCHCYPNDCECDCSTCCALKVIDIDSDTVSELESMSGVFSTRTAAKKVRGALPPQLSIQTMEQTFVSSNASTMEEEVEAPPPDDGYTRIYVLPGQVKGDSNLLTAPAVSYQKPLSPVSSEVKISNEEPTLAPRSVPATNMNARKSIANGATIKKPRRKFLNICPCSIDYDDDNEDSKANSNNFYRGISFSLVLVNRKFKMFFSNNFFFKFKCRQFCLEF